MHLVLHRLKKRFRNIRIRVIVDACRIDVGDLLVEYPLARTDVTDPCEQFIEIIVTQSPACFDPLVVEREALDE
jgi:hypothetical protein